jgi:hypothetical protein
VRERDQLRPAGQLLGNEARAFFRRQITEACDAHLCRRCEQRSEQSEMLDVGGHDLVLAGEAETGEHDVARVRGRADERDVLRSDLEHCGQRLSGALAQGDCLFEVRIPAATPFEVAAVELRHSIDGRARERAVRARVQVRIALEDGELGSGFLERQATLASTGV